MAADEERSVVADVIRGLVERVEAYEQRTEKSRADMRADFAANLVQLRKDFHIALSPLQLDNIDHRRAHEADRAERTERQTLNDRNFDNLRRDIRALSIMIAVTLVLVIVGAAVLIVRFG